MGIEQMPDINKIREELDKKNAEMEKKEQERIEEEYKRSSEQEGPNEELIKDKIEESEKKKKGGIEKEIKDENIIQKLNPENVKAAEIFKDAYKKGKFIEVKIKRPSGEIEGGWVISKINPKTGEATVLKFTSEKEKEGKDISFVDEIVTLEELKEWNKPKTEGPEEKKEADKTEIGELLKGAKAINIDDIINEKTKKKKEKGSAATKTSGNETKGPKEKEKENLEKEITEKYYNELKKIKDMPNKSEGFNKTAELKMKKAEKCFQLIEGWKDSAYLDDYKGIKEIFSELDKLKPSMPFYNLKKVQAVNKIGLTMAFNYEEWDLENKEKLKIIKNFVNGQLEKENIFYSKDKTLKGIAKILALEDIPYKNNIDVIVKEIKNQDIKAETIAEMLDIEKNSIKKKEQSLKTLKEDMKHDKLPPEKIIMEQLEKFGIDPKVASEILSKLPNILENPQVRKEFEEVVKSKEFQKLQSTVEGEIPESLKKVEKYIKDEKKESSWKTAFESAGFFSFILIIILTLLGSRGVDYLSGQATGKK